MIRKRPKKSNTRHRTGQSIGGGVYCPQAHKRKQFFATEQEAGEYLLANAETIRWRGGYAPRRIYYCEACGGWHLSSKGQQLSMAKK